MSEKVYSAAVQGVEALLVEVEVGTRMALEPRTLIVGLPDTAVRESSERVHFSLKQAGFYKEPKMHVINLAPADLKKEGPSFDLPIAIGMAVCDMDISLPALKDYLIAGELSLDGTLRPVKGVLALVTAAKKAGKKAILLPRQNAEEACLISGIEVYGAGNLEEAWEHLVGAKKIPLSVSETDLSVPPVYPIDFSEVKGQAHVKRAIEIAAAGNHNILLSGPPGTGKSMIAQRIPTILPPLTEQEAIETTKVFSIKGQTLGDSTIVRHRPFRSPHHSISDAGLLGGGSVIMPGEVSMANNGVLFLDEFPEFKRTTLEGLRQPLEDGCVSIARASGTLNFPSQFMLAAAMNPCPCGFRGDVKTQCSCNPRQLENYQNRLSGPILDRIDIQVTVPRVDYKELRVETLEESSSSIRERVINARNIQIQRYGIDSPCGTSNAQANGAILNQHCTLDAATHDMMERAMNKFGYSGRAHNRILKVARTIADLAGEERILAPHVQEAIQLRSQDRYDPSAKTSPQITKFPTQKQRAS